MNMSEIHSHPDWLWFEAVYNWDYDDPVKLCQLIHNRPIPSNFKPIVISIIKGKRKQEKKAAAKFKCSVSDRLDALIRLHYIIRYLDGIDIEHPGDKDHIREEKSAAYKQAAEALYVNTKSIRHTYKNFIGYIHHYKFISQLQVK